MTQPYRVSDGGIVDRSRPLRFVYDGAPYVGYAGDTVASALLANGVHLVARSFKYHRPRGIHAAGIEEPSALLQLGEGARSEPNVRATVQPLYDGLVAESQNRWPSLRFDVGAINDAASRFIPAGFYYKTFMWPATPKAWMRYEHMIRRAAGMGVAASAPDPDHYEHQYAHCDVLVIGAGPSGLAAARAAAHGGARVIVCDENPVLGGSLLGSDAIIDDAAAAAWIATTREDLASLDDVMLLPSTSAFGCYDGALVGLCERVGDPVANGAENAPRGRGARDAAFTGVDRSERGSGLPACPGDDAGGHSGGRQPQRALKQRHTVQCARAIAQNCPPAASSTIAWKISWYPKTRGFGLGQRRA